jgi:hypothetical protein
MLLEKEDNDQRAIQLLLVVMGPGLGRDDTCGAARPHKQKAGVAAGFRRSLA